VETTGSTAVLRQGADALTARGTLVIVGALPFGSEVALDVTGMLPVKLVRSGRLPLDKLVTQYRLEDIGQAVSDMTAGKTIKPVLTF
jgi:aryl-alcohol dehydrogenase